MPTCRCHGCNGPRDPADTRAERGARLVLANRDPIAYVFEVKEGCLECGSRKVVLRAAETPAVGRN